MSNSSVEPPVPLGGQDQPRPSKKEAKAQAAADKAYAKSQRSWFARHKILTALGALLLFGIIITAINGRGGSSDNNSAATGTPASQSTSIATKEAPAPKETAQPSKPAPKPAAPKPAAPAPEPAEPSLTAGQENALKAAENYLSFTAFSRAGLIRQLSSSAGDGYALKDATYAADHVKVDWNEQAAKAAKNYLSMMAFSRSSLIRQLTSSAGDGYTRAQALYGVEKAGL